MKRWANCTDDSCTANDKDRYTPLIYAAEHEDEEAVRVLLEGGANVDRTDAYRWTALHCAGFYGYLDVCRLLLDWGAKVDPLNESKSTPLHYAANMGKMRVVMLLVERGADVRLRDKFGRTTGDVALGEIEQVLTKSEEW